MPGEQYNLSDYERLTGKKITEFHEAPALSELVKQGKLPPVEERLPKNPLVVTPHEEIGEYGGVLRRVWYGIADWWNIGRICFEGLIMADKTGSEFLPNIFEDLRMEENGKVFIAKIREGLKWSDGVPVTTEDVLFWYHDIFQNKNFTSAIPDFFKPGGDFTIEAVDTYTFKIIFQKPYPLFPLFLTDQIYSAILLPSHYVRNFLPEYIGQDKIEKQAKEKGYSSWQQFVLDYCLLENAWVRNPDLPVLFPWKLSDRSTDELTIFERNPYYFKVDTEGNQLPYIDEIHLYRVANKQILLMKALAGEIDFQMRGFTTDDYQILTSNAEKGGYRVILVKKTTGSGTSLFMNQTYTGDPIIAELLKNPKFRYAISLAINREEILHLAYLGLGEPRQASLVTGVKYYDPEWEKAFAEYDPERANKLLDEIGLEKRDKEGYRLRPDGKRLELIIEYTEPRSELELIKSYIESLGIKVLLKQEERSLWFTRLEAGEMQIGVWVFGSISIFLDPDMMGYKWAPLAYQWYVNGKKGGIEPEKGTDLRKLYDLWDQILFEPNEEKRDALVKELINLFKKNIWIIGTVGEFPLPAVVKDNLKNVPEGLLFDFHLLKTPKNFRPEQFFFKK